MESVLKLKGNFSVKQTHQPTERAGDKMRFIEHSVSNVNLEHDRIQFDSLTPLMFDDIKRFKAGIAEPALIVELFDENDTVRVFIFDSFACTTITTAMLNKYIKEWRTSLN